MYLLAAKILENNYQHVENQMTLLSESNHFKIS